MDCATADCLLDLYREDRLTPARRAEVKTHLDSCKTCAKTPVALLSGRKTTIPEDLKKELLKLSPEDRSAPKPGAALDAAPYKKSGDSFVLAATAALVLVLSMIHFGTDTVPQQQFENNRVVWSGR